ncbi:hypothetical protein EIN_390590, partial [Entamoeba invadens IP1]
MSLDCEQDEVLSREVETVISIFPGIVRQEADVLRVTIKTELTNPIEVVFVEDEFIQRPYKDKKSAFLTTLSDITLDIPTDPPLQDGELPDFVVHCDWIPPPVASEIIKEMLDEYDTSGGVGFVFSWVS